MIVSFFQYFIPFTVLLGVLIFIHELGHFLVARFFGVRVEVFSLGFGPKLFKYKKGDTVYCFSLIPLGGYVKMFGDNPQQIITGSDRAYAFLCQKVWPKIAIVLAGPIMNFLLAIVLFMMIGFIGREQISPQLGDIKINSKAYKAGFQPKDRVLSVNGKPVSHWQGVQKEISNNPEKILHFVVQREKIQLPIKVQSTKKEDTRLTSLQKYIGQVEGLTVVSDSSHVGVSDHSSLAYKSGLRSFDEIKEINGVFISSWSDLKKAFLKSLHTSVLFLKVKRNEVDDAIIQVQIPMSSSISTLRELGIEDTSLYIDRVKTGSPADIAGLTRQDRLLSLNAKRLFKWSDFSQGVKKMQKDSLLPLKITVLRDGEKKSFSLIPENMPVFQSDGSIEYRKMIGIASAQYISLPPKKIFRIINPLKAFSFGVSETMRWVSITVKVLYKLVTGSISRRMLGGPLSIAKAAKQSSDSVVRFLQIMAIISVNLFLMNLLPIPVLDGGHLMLFIIEGIKGSPLSIRKIEILHIFGFALLIAFIFLTLFNDIQNWHLIW